LVGGQGKPELEPPSKDLFLNYDDNSETLAKAKTGKRNSGRLPVRQSISGSPSLSDAKWLVSEEQATCLPVGGPPHAARHPSRRKSIMSRI
jgi:hypothetical protein